MRQFLAEPRTLITPLPVLFSYSEARGPGAAASLNEEAISALHEALHYMATHGFIFLRMCLLHTLYMLVKNAWLFWHARGRGDLTCTVTPAAPHVLQLGKLHSARLSSQTCSRVARDPSAQTTHWIRWPRGDRTNVLFKEAEPPSCRCVLNSPPESSFFMTHGHTIAAHWACPLMFARARVHNVHTWQGEAELRGRVMTKCKGRWKGDCFCSSRSHDNIYDLHLCVSALINSCESGHVSCVLQAAHMFSSRNQGRSLKHNSQIHAAAGSRINRISCWKW